MFFYPHSMSKLTPSERILEMTPSPKRMQYCNINLVFIQSTQHLYVLGMSGCSPGSQTRDLIFRVNTCFWQGTRVTVKLWPDVAKIQSLKTLNHNCEGVLLWCATLLLIYWPRDGLTAGRYRQNCRYTFISPSPLLSFTLVYGYANINSSTLHKL